MACAPTDLGADAVWASERDGEQMARLQKEKRVSKREKEKDLEMGTWVRGRGRGREGAP